MEEIVTEAIVLESKTRWSGDRQVSLFTKDLGKIEAKATSGAKITSKLSPHLNTMNFSQVRLVYKNNYIITDALIKNRFEGLRKKTELTEKALEVISVINLITPPNLKDLELWYYLITGLNKNIFDSRILLKILGYDPKMATCFMCGKKGVSYFLALDQSFVCEKCAEKIDVLKLFKI
jgi:DNA repair protein RecO (recombination protein O)